MSYTCNSIQTLRFGNTVSRYEARRKRDFKFYSLNLKNISANLVWENIFAQASENKKQSKNYRAISELKMITKNEKIKVSSNQQTLKP